MNNSTARAIETDSDKMSSAMTAEYIAELAAELEALARSSKLSVLATFLAAAREEAEARSLRL